MPIFTAIGGVVAGSLFGLAAGTSAFAIASSLVAGGLAFATKLGISYLTREKQRKYSAVQGEVQVGADTPAGTLFGTGAVKGQRVYYAKYGSGNKYNADVFVLANGWCDGLEDIYFYGEKQKLEPQPIVGNETANYACDGFGNNLSIRFYDGRPGQGVDQRLVDLTANLGKKWKATSVGAGQCYVVIEREYDDRFSRGRPDFTFVLRGLRCYDVRKDSTVAGGSGPHRLDNPATYEFSKNPAVQRMNYQLGLRGLISGRTLIGEGKTLGQLDLGSYIAAMNVCDTVRPNGKKTYESALYVTGNDDHTEILKEFDDAMAGYGVNRRGLSGIIVGAPQIPVLTITADDIPVDRAQEVAKRKSAFDLYNTISGQFTSPESQWNAESLKTVYVNADIAKDGRRRQTANDFLQVSDADIAQYLLDIRYRQNRKGGSATVPVSRRVGLAVMEGEWVNFDGKTWLITEWQCDERFQITLKLAETGSDIYSDGGIEPGPIVIPPVKPINPSLLSTVQNFNVDVGLIAGANGRQKPALKFTWDPPADPSITQVRFFYRPADDETEEYEDDCKTPERGKYITSKDVESGKQYVARATITTVPDRFKTFTPWVTTAGETGLQYTDVLDGTITRNKIADAAIDASKLMDEAVTNLKLAAGAVSTAKLQVSAVTEAILATSAVTTSKLADLAITNAKIGPLAVDAAKIAANAITETKISDNAISTPKLQANAVVADKIAANVISASKLVITDLSNIIPDNGLLDNSAWTLSAGVTLINSPIPSGTAPSSINSARVIEFVDSFTGGGNNIQRQNCAMTVSTPAMLITCQAGASYAAGYKVRSAFSPVASGSIGMFVQFFDSTMTALPEVNVDGYWNAPQTSVQSKQQIFSAPATAAYMAVRFRRGTSPAGASEGTIYVFEPYIRRAASGELIVDGAIIASKLAVDSVTAGAIAAGAVTAVAIQAGSITGDKIQASAITGDKIAGNTITGDKIVANTITTTNMVMTDFTNLVENPYFAAGNNGSWTVGTGLLFQNNPALAYIGSWRYSVAAGHPSAWANPRYIEIEPGTDVSFVVAARGINTPSGTLGTFFQCYDENNVLVANVVGPTFSVADTSYARKVVGGVIPAGTVKGRVVFTATTPLTGIQQWAIGFVGLFRRSNAELIVDGSITAAKIAANSITAGMIQAGAITAAKIAVGTITADRIVLGGVSTDRLAISSVTDTQTLTGSSTNTGTFGSWVTITSGAISNPNPNPVFCQVILRARVVSSSGGGSSAGTTTQWINNNTGEVIGSVGAASTAGSVGDNSIDQFYLDDTPTTAGNYTYLLRRQHTSSGGTINTCINSGTLKMIWWKR